MGFLSGKSPTGEGLGPDRASWPTLTHLGALLILRATDGSGDERRPVASLLRASRARGVGPAIEEAEHGGAAPRHRSVRRPAAPQLVDDLRDFRMMIGYRLLKIIVEFTLRQPAQPYCPNTTY